MTDITNITVLNVLEDIVSCQILLLACWFLTDFIVYFQKNFLVVDTFLEVKFFSNS